MQPSQHPIDAEGALRAQGKFLTFLLANEQYGIAILKIREIIGLAPITPIPRTPDFVKGVANIRGDEVEPAPSFGLAVDTAFILGMAKGGGEVKILLDIDQVLSQAEFAALAKVA
jgi:chemotaxis signal transduction protein